MSQHDAPVWVRAVAAVLLLVACWWLLATELLRNIIGESVAALGLCVVAFSVLRGLHLPLRIWPEGPWREEFRKRAVFGTALVIGAVILLSRTGMSDGLAGRLDIGTFILVAAGTVFWGYGIAMVKQRSYLQWYGLALILGAAPVALAVAFGNGLWATDTEGGACWWVAAASVPEGTMAYDRCGAAFVPGLLFLLGTGVATKLVAEELAFRRLLIGCARHTGLVWILAAAVAATAWYWTLTISGIGDTTTVALGGLGAASAGCIYVLSCSLPVSALYVATLTAGSAALELSRPIEGAASAATTELPTAFWLALSLTAIMLCAMVGKRNGLLGRLRVEGHEDVVGH